jgi:hypothetical protein
MILLLDHQVGCWHCEDIVHRLAPSQSVEHVRCQEIGMVELTAVWNVDSIHDLAASVY